jgi:hypothetical protein
MYDHIETLDERTIEEQGIACFRALGPEGRKMYLRLMVNEIELQVQNGSRVRCDTPDFVLGEMFPGLAPAHLPAGVEQVG